MAKSNPGLHHAPHSTSLDDCKSFEIKNAYFVITTMFQNKVVNYRILTGCHSAPKLVAYSSFSDPKILLQSIIKQLKSTKQMFTASRHKVIHVHKIMPDSKNNRSDMVWNRISI